MKKIFFFPLSALPVLLSAQITINSSNVVNAGEYVIQVNDTTPSISPGTAGPNQTWNFSNLNNHTEDTIQFVNPSTLQGYAYYPTANIGVPFPADSMNIFVLKDNNALKILGFYAYTNPPLSAPISFRLITFPSTYNTAYTDNYSFVINTIYFGNDPDGPGPHPMVDSLRVKRRGDINSIIDGWGNVTTPLGTFPSIRQNFREITTDSIQMYATGQWQPLSPTMVALLQMYGYNEVNKDTAYSLRWWSNDANVRINLVELNWDGNSTIYSATWLKASPSSSAVPAIADNSSIHLYPNPASTYLSLELNKGITSQVSVYDMQGNIVCEKTFTENRPSLNISSLPAGNYLITITDLHTGELIGKATFVKE